MTRIPFACIGVDDLIQNAELRTELEPYLDESVFRVHFRHRSIRIENEFLAGMLDWEMSPVEPIARWFEPELKTLPPERLTDDNLPAVLEEVVQRLFEKKIILDFTNHLSDRDLYTLIYRDILPLREKNLQHRNGYMHWDCSCGDDDLWLRYYASDDERNEYVCSTGDVLPPKEIPPYYRDMPRPFELSRTG
ncbi:MAG: hypothetical protein LBT46_03965 [Planctomycetaceae bacterium]|jgi:hypothetical protein|nr:hypothetical protein [Planctomycetaceae bacterium]